MLLTIAHAPPVSLALSLLLFAASADSATPHAKSPPDVRPGQWEVSTEVKLPQLPFGLALPPNMPLPQPGARSVCITKQDIAQPHALVNAQTGCLLRHWTAAGAQVQWQTTCAGPPLSRSSGKLLLEGDTLRGSATVTTVIQGFELPVDVSYSGQRIGDCRP